MTSGSCGYVGVATGVGSTVLQANEFALAVARRVVVPNLRYRNDIGQKLINGDFSTLRKQGYLPATLAL